MSRRREIVICRESHGNFFLVLTRRDCSHQLCNRMGKSGKRGRSGGGSFTLRPITLPPMFHQCQSEWWFCGGEKKRNMKSHYISIILRASREAREESIKERGRWWKMKSKRDATWNNHLFISSLVLMQDHQFGFILVSYTFLLSC